MKKLLLLLIIACLHSCAILKQDQALREWKGTTYQELIKQKGEPHDWILDKNKLVAVYYDTTITEEKEVITWQMWFYMKDQVSPITKAKIEL